MIHYVPDIRLATELPVQTQIEEKLGGIPWGLPSDRWPKCAECSKSQSLLAQFIHDTQRLDLGREGRCLFVFQCNHDPGMCSTWERDAGANACFVMEPEDLLEELSNVPDDGPPLEREVRIVGWIERDDGLPEVVRPAFYDAQAHSALPEETWMSASMLTHLGSVPWWVQSPGDAPGGEWEFVGQLDDSYSFFSTPGTLDNLLTADPEGWQGRTHVATGPNFGSGGCGYIFLRKSAGVPKGTFFWQC